MLFYLFQGIVLMLLNERANTDSKKFWAFADRRLHNIVASFHFSMYNQTIPRGALE